MTAHTEYRRLPGMVKVEVWAWQCERCDHFWLPRDWDNPPKVCPKCKSPYWDRPRRKESTGPVAKKSTGGVAAFEQMVKAHQATWTETR